MSRTKEREELFKIIFQMISGGAYIIPEEKEYIKKGYETIKEKKNEIEALVKNSIAKWNFKEIGDIEKALLFVAVYEIKFDNLSEKIVINEAVELAKRYGHQEASKFINGVLANLIKEK